MTGQPIKRVYFDTNRLQGWPSTVTLSPLFRTANWLNTELYIPDTVESELEEQFIRKINAAYGSTNTGTKELKKLLHGIKEIEISVPRIAEDELRRAFRTRSSQLKAHFRISSIPLEEIPTQRLVQMAIRRQPPFEEIRINNEKTVVTGLQDAAILFSILNHLKDLPTAERNVFLSSDGVFRKPETQRVIAQHGVKLEVCKDPRTLFDELYDHIWETIRVEWHAEMEQVTATLNASKQALTPELLALLPVANLGGYRAITELQDY